MSKERIISKFPTLAALLLAGALLAATAGTSTAALLWEYGFDNASSVQAVGGRQVEFQGGTGWAPGKRGGHAGSVVAAPDRVEFPVSLGTSLVPEAGTVRLRVRYQPVLPAKLGRGWSNTLIDFLKADRSTAILVYMEWDPGEGEQTRLNVWASGFKKDVYGPYIPLGFRAKPGDTVDLALTWGQDPVRDNKVYINGREVAEYHESHEGGPAPRTARLGSYLSSVSTIRVGIDSESGVDYPGGRAPAVDTVFDAIQVYDRPMTPEELGMISPIPIIRSVADDTFQRIGISGKLVSGDTVTVTLAASPGGKASFEMGKAAGIPMEEVPPTAGAPGITAVDNGTYRGSYTVLPGDDFENGRIVGHFVSADNVAAEPVASASKWTIDTKPVVTFNIDRKDLPADSATKARIKLAAKDANGNPVKGRHLKLTLATTDEYTGTVGTGDFGKEIGATVETRWKGETDSWGEVEFDYTAGFAAKTVILTAKDLDSGGVTVDYITAFKEASIDIALTQPVSRAAARRGLQYILKVEASRTELTADGRSRSVIRATLLDPNGAAVAGDPVAFTLSSPNGTLRTIAGTTDSSGTATADYTAGKKIGIVVVTATATLRNASGNVSIILLSDAPAKIYLKARPETLPADGFSRTDLSVKVTDINDNPNRDTKVAFRVGKGGGKLEYVDRVTDRFGDAQNRYTAGTAPGIASVVATVRSKIPTDAELAKARNVLFTPYAADSDSIRVEKWLKKKGESFVRGEPLVEYTAGRRGAPSVVTAPYDGMMGDILVEYWDNAEVGQTLAILVPATK